MRELSNKTITAQAEKHAELYDRMFRKAARHAFIEGAKWFASEMEKGLKAIEDGN